VKKHQDVVTGKSGSEDGILLILKVGVKLYLNVMTVWYTWLILINLLLDIVNMLLELVVQMKYALNGVMAPHGVNTNLLVLKVNIRLMVLRLLLLLLLPPLMRTTGLKVVKIMNTVTGE